MTAGDGLTGGGSSGSVTLNVVGGDGITANANDIAITAAQTTITSVKNTSLVVGRDNDNGIHFSTDNAIKVEVNGVQDEFRFVAGGEFHADADIVAFSSTTASDKNLKENVEALPYGLDDVMKMRAVEFDWKKDKANGKERGHDIGVIAQEMEEVIPEVVKEYEGLQGKDNFKAVDYSKLVPVLIKSIQELKAEIEELKKMSLTASGQIKFSDINTEFGRTSTTGDTSLEDLSDGTVATINTQNDSADRPDGSAPHAISEFYSYDHDLAGTSWSVADNTGLNLTDFPGQTAQSTKDAQMTVNNGSGGTSCSLSTSGGPFGNFKLAISSSGDPGSGGSSNSGSGFITTSSANSNSLFTGHNSGTRFIRTQWQHTPSNKDGTGSYTLTLTNNSQTATITGTISFAFGGGPGLCIYENIPVNLKEGTANIHDLNIGDMIMSYNWETGQEEEVEIQQIEKDYTAICIKLCYQTLTMKQREKN